MSSLLTAEIGDEVSRGPRRLQPVDSRTNARSASQLAATFTEAGASVPTRETRATLLGILFPACLPEDVFLPAE